MKREITIRKTNQSRISEVDFHNIPFGRVFSDHMFVAEYSDGKWHSFEIVPFGPIQIHPATMALHYGQSIFEGMKASKSVDGVPFLFRPELHAERFNASARRMCMPDVPVDLFLEALHQLISLDREWIPPVEGSALYIRPLMFASDQFIGVKPSQTYKLVILTGPVGPYYPKPVSLLAETTYIRAARGGVGEAKTAGNYAASMLPAQNAQSSGYDQVLWLDGFEFKYIQEVGTMNIFFVVDGKVLTPVTDGAILKGVTRDCVIQILRDKGIDTEIRRVSIDEIVEAYKQGKLEEAFGTGTAAVVAHVSRIAYKDMIMELNPDKADGIGKMVKTLINEMRAGKLEDEYGWIVPVNSEVTVNV